MQSKQNQLSRSSKNLSELARQANAAHERCVAAVNEGLRHAMEAGRLLSEARGLVPHGGWTDWVEEHFAFSLRTAQMYLLIFNSRSHLSPDAQRAAPMSIREAVRVLADADDPLE